MIYDIENPEKCKDIFFTIIAPPFALATATSAGRQPFGTRLALYTAWLKPQCPLAVSCAYRTHTANRGPLPDHAMADETPDPCQQDLPGYQKDPAKPPKRPRPRPGRHGSGQRAARATPPVAAAAAKPDVTHKESPKPAVDYAFATQPPPKVALPAAASAKGSLAAPRSSQAVPVHGLLSLEDTISVATALAVLRGEAIVLHIETTGPDPLRDEILAIHVRRFRKHRTTAELSLQVLPLRALPAATAEDGLGSEAGRPPAKRQDVPLQEAVTRLLEFLGTHRQHVFVHGSAGTQAFLGQAARQYGMMIENPVGDAVDLARLAWPGRANYSLSELAGDLLPELGPIRTAADATKAILGLLQAASKVLAGSGGVVSRSIAHWGASPDTLKLKPSPW